MITVFIAIIDSLLEETRPSCTRRDSERRKARSEIVAPFHNTYIIVASYHLPNALPAFRRFLFTSPTTPAHFVTCCFVYKTCSPLTIASLSPNCSTQIIDLTGGVYPSLSKPGSSRADFRIYVGRSGRFCIENRDSMHFRRRGNLR